MSKKILQNLVWQIKDIIHEEFGVLDRSGTIIACSDERKIGTTDVVTADFIMSNEENLCKGNTTFKKVYVRNRLEFIVYIESNDEYSRNYLSLISVSVQNVKIYYDEKFDKNSFVKNIILDNILPGDIQLRSKELHLEYNAKRVAFLIKTEKTVDIYTLDLLQSLFPNKSRDFVVVLDDENTALIKELKDKEDIEQIEKKAKIIIDTINTELMVKASVGIGTIVDNLRDIGKSYKEAQMAILIGGIFENEKRIINYNNLGIGRLIYQLPTTLCKLFLDEVFKDGTFDTLDGETMITIQKFFENNLNVSETSRQLFIHRNTLVYRLDKIQKLTGLDLRKFDDAIYFKVAMLVKRYLDKTEQMAE